MQTQSAATIRKNFKNLLNDRYSAGRTIMCPRAHDCVTANYIEYLGTEHINVGAAAPTAAWTGEPKCGVIAMTEMADAASTMLRGTDLPGEWRSPRAETP